MSLPRPGHTLESAIDAVLESYQGPAAINNLKSAMLPNKQAVIAAYEHLKPVLFIGFYSSRTLRPDNLRSCVSAHLYPAHELLTDQLGRVLSYEASIGRSEADCPQRAEEIVLRLFGKLPAIRHALEADCHAAFEGDPAARSIEEVILSYPAVEAIMAHRVAHVLYSEGVPMIPRIISEYAHERTGIDIHPGAKIGPGFFIDHGTGVVIGETTVIGRKVKLYQGVTLGALSVKRCDDVDGRPRQRHPTIEDDVTIYAGATILGGETVIGAGSVIGGNTWLIRSVPPGSKVYGNKSE